MRAGFARQRRHPQRLSRRQRAVTYAIVALAWGSGVLWLIFHYFLTRQGEFGPAPHVLEVWWLRLHGIGAFAALWLAGWLWGVHVRPALAGQKRRFSGIVLLALFALLAVSGYLLYYAADGGLRDAIGLLHWLVGIALIAPLLWHVLRARSARHRATRFAATRGPA